MQTSRDFTGVLHHFSQTRGALLYPAVQGEEISKNTWLALRDHGPKPPLAPFSTCSSVQCCLFRAQSHVLQMLCSKKPLTPLKLYKSQGMLITQSEPIIPAQAPQSMGFADSPPQAFCLYQDYPRKSALVKHPHPGNIQGAPQHQAPTLWLSWGFQDLGFPILQTSFAEIGNLSDTEQAGPSQPFQELCEGVEIKEEQAPGRLGLIPVPEAGTPLCSLPVQDPTLREILLLHEGQNM